MSEYYFRDDTFLRQGGGDVLHGTKVERLEKIKPNIPEVEELLDYIIHLAKTDPDEYEKQMKIHGDRIDRILTMAKR